MNEIALYIIIGLLVFLVLAFVGYSFVKGKLIDRKIKNKEEILNKRIAEKYMTLIIEVVALINENEKMLDLFKNGKTKAKMGMITTATKKFLDSLIEQKIYRFFFFSENKYLRLWNEIKELENIRSNSWDKKIESTLKWFKNEEQKIVNEEKYSEIVEKVQDRISKIYDFEEN
ncbi:hypothetical protein EI74_0589 [Mycoplasma testudineum]|uniref:Uncharacterized protein n=1 Tax=Mycoplasma testudineum TaxID=244584 RepID=A0A4R6IDL4_9MOLU|nr:FeoB-associated Cys-rich membrane protein [Mycoplasma testudineum]OYD26657.1 hypothetical protein CG473_02545 [Mycoplasma testudineum]TDO19786.1 hypothetical protein EI74_0589 [Mycoplasma testudineum]